MKKNLLLIVALLVVLTLFNLKANAQATTGAVPVNIILSDAFSIVLGPAPDVTFTYSTAEQYASSQTVPKANHFTVVSNKAYNVTVNATGEFTVLENTVPVPLDVVQVAVNPTTPATDATYATPFLTMGEQPLVTGARPTVGTAYNVDYTIPSALPLIGKVPGTYSTNVVYTVTQQ